MQDKLLSWAEKSCDVLMDWRKYPSAEHLKAPLLIAHRGAWDSAITENTMAAFKKAQSCGMDGIELDVHFTADDVPVVHHDPELSRLHGRTERILDLKFEDLRRIAPAVPTFEEVLALKNLHFMVEIKTALTPGHLKILEGKMQGLAPVRDFHLLSLEPDLVRESSAFPGKSWILVGQVQMRTLVEISIAHEFGGAAGHYLGMTRGLIDRLHARQQAAGVGFVASRNMLNRERARGVDFVFTNTAEKIGNG